MLSNYQGEQIEGQAVLGALDTTSLVLLNCLVGWLGLILKRKEKFSTSVDHLLHLKTILLIKSTVNGFSSKSVDR